MRSIAVALTWEYWRRIRRWVFAAIIVMACATYMMYGRVSSLDDRTHAKIHYMTVFYEFICFAYFILILSSQFYDKTKLVGFPVHLYAKPIRTWVLVAWQMFLLAATVMLFYEVSVGCAYILLGVVWPLAGPMLLLAAAVCCAQAIFWLMAGFPVLRFVAFLVVLVALNIWQFSRYGPIHGYPNTSRLTEMWAKLTAGELLTMLFCISAAYIVAVIGVSRDRRGDRTGLPGFWKPLGRVRELLPGGQRPFNSTAAAQFWREWNEKDWVMPAGSGMIVTGLILLTALHGDGATGAIKVLIGLSPVGLLVPFFAGTLLGQCGPKSRIDDFKATLPVSDSRLVAMILRPGAVSVLAGFAIYAAGMLFTIGWLFIAGEGDLVRQGWHTAVNAVGHEFGYGNAIALAAAGLIVACGLMGLGASMAFTGRPRLFLGFWLTICAVGPILILLSTLDALKVIPFGVVPALWSCLPWAVGIACLIGTVLAFFGAFRKYLITWSRVCLGLGLWLALCTCVGLIWLPRDDPRMATIVLVAGLLALPIAPLAAAPLALAWNRHR